MQHTETTSSLRGNTPQQQQQNKSNRASNKGSSSSRHIVTATSFQLQLQQQQERAAESCCMVREEASTCDSQKESRALNPTQVTVITEVVVSVMWGKSLQTNDSVRKHVVLRFSLQGSRHRPLRCLADPHTMEQAASRQDVCPDGCMLSQAWQVYCKEGLQAAHAAIALPYAMLTLYSQQKEFAGCC